MSPCDFFLFPRTKSVVKGTHFESDIKAAVTRVLAGIPVEPVPEMLRSVENALESLYSRPKGLLLKGMAEL